MGKADVGDGERKGASPGRSARLGRTNRVAEDFPVVPLAQIAQGHFGRPRAEVHGIVDLVHHEADGDRHFRLAVGALHIVCEVIPELPLPVPALGAQVAVRGIVRYDGAHRWWELHPVLSWLATST